MNNMEHAVPGKLCVRQWGDIKVGANMIFTSLKVNLKSVFKAEPGATIKIRQE